MNNIIGFQKEFELISKNLANKNLNNSILLTGNKGIGKFFFINKIIENYINLIVNPDQVNHHLSLFYNNSHPNIKILQKKIDEKTNKSKNHISIDQIRELNSFFRETSFIGNFSKFILIDSADDLNLNSSNALLKILEEPNINTYFFLISHKPSLLLPTIKSRCLKLNFLSHSFKNFKKILIIKNILLDDDKLEFLFDITNGSPGMIFDFDIEEIISTFNILIHTIIINENFLRNNMNTIDLLASFENEKFKFHLSLIKFILIIFKKVKMGINIKDNYLSKNILEIENLSDKITLNTIENKFDYLINNQNDLITFNLDKKIFMINFFAQK